MGQAMIKTAGTHNLLDGAAQALAFADVCIWTEATKAIWKDRVANKHRIYGVVRQRDLKISIDESIAAQIEGKARRHYRLVHLGIALVTPHRGIFWITFVLNGRKTAIIAEHRINAWYPPYRRGEKWYRSTRWQKHTKRSNRIQERLIAQGYDIYAGGDPNAPEGVEAYPLLHETDEAHLDRVASTRRIKEWRSLRKGGSDHHRLLAWFKDAA